MVDIQVTSPVICWWSGGVTSALACKIAIDLYGINNCRIILMDTKNEHEDTYRFKADCEKWYGKEIETITALGDKYATIWDVWRKHKSLNVANGAICSSVLKQELRKKWQKENDYSHQVFGFEFETNEFKRAMSLKLNHSNARPIFPLLMLGLSKKDCIDRLLSEGIEPPKAYQMGLANNNCLNTGCVQGGIGYWQKIKREMPDLFNQMAEFEHELTELKGSPVTMLKDQSKKAKESEATLVFLKKHKDYPIHKSIEDMTGREPEPLMECNGFCGVNDLAERKETEGDLNYQSNQPNLL